jgi:hypothetical protein
MPGFDPKTGSCVAWVCYRAKAYDQESDYVNTFEPKMSRRAEQTNIV